MSSTSSMPKLVLVTGANGYIGCSLIQSLLEQGFNVRGTLRNVDMENKQEVKVLMDMPNASTHLELVPLELEGPQEAFDKAVQGVEWIFHVAQPVSMRKIKDEQTIIGPAVTGTLNMLRAANATPCVTKFVLTSSIAAIVNDKSGAYTEEDWADVNAPQSIAYFKSKILGEKAAWNFMKEKKPSFTLSVINPGLVFGPVPNGNVKSTSDSIVGMTLRGGGVINLFCCFVDIRNVVQAHVQAAKIPEAAGKRFVLIQSNGGELYLPKIGEILNKEFGPMGYKIQTTPAPKWVTWIMSWFIPEIAGMWPMLDTPIHFDNSRSREILQIDYIPAEQTIIDGGYSLIEHGQVPKKPGFKSRS